jgi:hypothetical protein
MPTNEEILQSTQDLLNRVKTEGVTNNAGVQQAFSADSLNKALVAAQLPGNYVDPNANSYTSLYNTVTNGTDNNTSMPDWMKNYLEAPGPTNPQASGQQATDQAGLDAASATANANQQALINAQGELQGYNAQLQGIANETTQAGLKLREEGISAGAISGRNIANERDAAIRSLPIQSLALISQGKVATAQGNVALAQQLQQQAQAKLDKTFDIQMNYQQSLFDYSQKKRDAVMQYADKLQTQQLNAKAQADQNAWNVKQDSIKNAQSVANSLLQSQPQLASQISAIDWSKPTAQAEYAALLTQAKQDPMVALDLALKQQQLVTARKQYDLLGRVDPVEQTKITEAEKAKLATTQGQIETLEAKRNSIDKILSKENESALAGRVGTGILSRMPKTQWWNPLSWPTSIIDQSVGGAAFAGDVKQLASQEFLDKLIDVKNQGATFGALSDNEGTALRNAATKINNWEIKDDKGQGIGIWNVDESSFKAELNRIKDLANKAISKKQNTTLNSEEQSLLDNIFNNPDASSFFK